MSAIRKISLSAAALFLGLSALFVTTGTVTAETYTVQCDDDWNTPEPTPCP